jgi:ADP-heptose:LPS heptosyltransferase
LFVPDASIEGELGRWLVRCDCAVAWMQDETGGLTRTLEKAGAGKAIVSSPFSTNWKSLHQSDRYCETLRESPFRAAEFQPLQIPGEVSSRGRACLEEAGVRLNQPFVAVHPGSGSRRKSVSIQTMATIMTKLRTEGMIPVVIEGPADQEAVCDLLRRIDSAIAVLRHLDLTTLAGALSHAAKFIGHDSGVTHIAASLGVLTSAFFGPTDPGRWAPLGNHVTIIRAPRGFACHWKPFWGMPTRAEREEKNTENPGNSLGPTLSPPTPCARVLR